MSNAPYGQPPTHPAPAPGGPVAPSGGGQPGPSATVRPAGSLFRPGDDEQYPFGLPPEVVSRRRAERAQAPAHEASAPTPAPAPEAPRAYPTYSSHPAPVPSPAQADQTQQFQRAQDRRPDDGWIAEFDDGRQVELHGVALVGRNPQPRPGEQVELITVGDDARKVSKTHFALGVDERGIYVCDRGSTNGTAIENAPDDFRPCPEGEFVRLHDGQKLSFGDHSLRIRRKA